MTDTIYEIKTNMTPAEATKAIKRAAAIGPVTIRIHAGIDMPSSDEGKYYPWRASVEVTKKVALKMLADMQRFHDGKIARGEAAPLVEYRQHVLEHFEWQKGNPARVVWIG